MPQGKSKAEKGRRQLVSSNHGNGTDNHGIPSEERPVYIHCPSNRLGYRTGKPPFSGLGLYYLSKLRLQANKDMTLRKSREFAPGVYASVTLLRPWILRKASESPAERSDKRMTLDGKTGRWIVSGEKMVYPVFSSRVSDSSDSHYSYYTSTGFCREVCTPYSN